MQSKNTKSLLMCLLDNNELIIFELQQANKKKVQHSGAELTVVAHDADAAPSPVDHLHGVQ